MARKSGYLTALAKSIEEERKRLTEMTGVRDKVVAEQDSLVGAQKAKVDALVSVLDTLEKTVLAKKAAPKK